MSATPEDVLQFWFSDRVKPMRFRSTPEFDQEINEKFYRLWQEAISGKLDGWLDTAEGALALVIILDQFPLHMFRNEARAFFSEQQARDCAEHAILNKLDEDLNNEQKAFLYIPFMHSESISDQDRSVALYKAAGLTDNLRWAQHHREIIRRFGRFPHRNSTLGRKSSQQELDYLTTEDAFKG